MLGSVSTQKEGVVVIFASRIFGLFNDVLGVYNPDGSTLKDFLNNDLVFEVTNPENNLGYIRKFGEFLLCSRLRDSNTGLDSDGPVLLDPETLAVKEYLPRLDDSGVLVYEDQISLQNETSLISVELSNDLARLTRLNKEENAEDHVSLSYKNRTLKTNILVPCPDTLSESKDISLVIKYNKNNFENFSPVTGVKGTPVYSIHLSGRVINSHSSGDNIELEVTLFNENGTIVGRMANNLDNTIGVSGTIPELKVLLGTTASSGETLVDLEVKIVSFRQASNELDKVFDLANLELDFETVQGP